VYTVPWIDPPAEACSKVAARTVHDSRNRIGNHIEVLKATTCKSINAGY
jgi:hypothetical protein